MGNISTRNNGLDFLKAICAFLIVCIHIPFPSVFGEYFVALARIAVPIFFMITGYFYSETIHRKRTGAQIKKIALLTLWANLFYFVFNSAIALVKGNICDYFMKCFELKSIVKLLIFNESPFHIHLWYLNALLYLLIIIYTCSSRNFSYTKLYPLIPVLLLTDLVLGKYSILLFGREFPYIIVRNFMFTGMPFFLLGCFIKDGGLKKFDNKKLLSALSIIFILTTIAERMVLINLEVNATRDQYISTAFLAVSVFMLFNRFNNRKLQGVCSIGNKYSTMIYIIHPAFIKVSAIASAAVLSGITVYIYSWLAPIIIFTVSAVFAVLFEKLPFKKK